MSKNVLLASVFSRKQQETAENRREINIIVY